MGKKETDKDLKEAVDKLREQRSSELQQLRQKKGKESNFTLKEVSEKELANHVTELRKDRNTELEALRQNKLALQKKSSLSPEKMDNELAHAVSNLRLQRISEIEELKLKTNNADSDKLILMKKETKKDLEE